MKIIAKAFVVYFSIILLSGCNRVTNNTFSINGTINGINNEMVYLKKYTDTGYVTIDSAKSVGSKFQFNGYVKFPEMFRIIPAGNIGYIPLFVENSKIELYADTNNFINVKISGSKSNELYNQLMAKIDSIGNLSKPFYDSIEIAKQNNNVSIINVFENKLDQIDSMENNCIINFVNENSTSNVSVYLMYKYLSGQLDEIVLTDLFGKLDTTLRSSSYYKLFENQLQILRRTGIGQQAIDFSLPDTNGNEIKLSSLYGKYLLIDFWASWCPSCRQENPNVVRTFKEFAPKGFTVLGISLDYNKNSWLTAIEKDQLTWTHVSDLQGWNNKAAKLYGIRSIPSNLLINPKGIIVAKNIRGKELEKKLNELLK